jgi:hypothetical protein
MTRYEMAQIVAKAMAKGANVDKLAAEFADELDALGVRVAALEKKSDNVKITGKIRYRYMVGKVKGSGITAGTTTKERYHQLRSDLTINGKINDGWTYTAMLRNQQNFINDIGDEGVNFQRAYVNGRVGGVKVQAGRYNEGLMVNADPYDNRVDALKLTYGDKFKIAGWYGKPTALNGAAVGDYSVFAGVRLSYDWDKWGVWAEYDKFGAKNRVSTPTVNPTRDLFGIGFNGKLGKDFGLIGQFLHGKAKNNDTGKKNGWSVEVTYKGADKAKVGSWGMAAKYYDMGNWTYFAGMKTYDAFDGFVQNDGYKGFRVTADYTVAKNMVAGLQYYDLKGKGNGGEKEKTFLAQMMFYF